MSLSMASLGYAQQPINATDAGTAPSPGAVVLMHQFHFESLKLENGAKRDQGRVRDYLVMSQINVGLTRDWSASLRAPVTFRDRSFDSREGDESDLGIGDVTLLAKRRLWREDVNALDTKRLAGTIGVDIRTGDDPFTSDGYDPIVGLGYTQVSGRHGFNAALQWTFTTGGNDDPVVPGESTADLFRYDAAYLYRLYPAEFSADSHGGLYAVAELNGFYETNGDNEIRLSPGLMWEAATWTLELSVQIPVWRDIARRADTEFILVAGIRISL
ncbi:MAG: hypothetical protein ACKVS9_01545 [Phycisphaerae bacterium]